MTTKVEEQDFKSEGGGEEKINVLIIDEQDTQKNILCFGGANGKLRISDGTSQTQ